MDHCLPLSSLSVSPQADIKYRCGVNVRESTKEHYSACIHEGRPSSCKCLTAGKFCASICKCKGCNNPIGKRIPHLGKRKRERAPHDWEKVSTTTANFANEREVLAHGTWSAFESIVFVQCFKYLELNLIDCNGSTLRSLYNSVLKYLDSAYCTFP